MARLPRYFVKGQPQHIIQRGNNRELIFVEDDDYQFYLECLQAAMEKNKLSVHAYVLMTNHVHLLVSPEFKDSIAKTLQSVGRRYVQYFNYTYKRTGTLWEGRYKATVIDSEQYLLTCMRYIELNSVRAGMVEKPLAYPWSSYGANAKGDCNKLIQAHDIYRQMGIDESARQLAYRKLFRRAIKGTELDALREATNKGWVLGSDHFRDEIERLSGRRAGAKPRGRPKKAG
ncbi:MAG: transposase, IS200/IS605 family [Methyloprofundus sp.]|nr:MAG: transposase, IS200/IS605 family [Methyloprofundus sp.]